MPPTGEHAYHDPVRNASPDLRFGILGPLEVIRANTLCTPSASKQRTLLGILLIRANELLSTDLIINEIWGHSPPRSAMAALQTYVAAVRRALTGQRGADPRRHPVLRTHPFGYALYVEPDQLDLTRFQVLAAQGRDEVARGRCGGAGESFRHALALWRGAALADLNKSGALARYAVRLEEERIGLLQERIEVDLCQGRGVELTGEIEELCDRYPLREAFHRQLMTAFYLSGNRADALRVYNRAYRILMDELGIEPGAGLQALQRAILDGRAPARHQHGKFSR